MNRYQIRPARRWRLIFALLALPDLGCRTDSRVARGTEPSGICIARDAGGLELLTAIRSVGADCNSAHLFIVPNGTRLRSMGDRYYENRSLVEPHPVYNLDMRTGKIAIVESVRVLEGRYTGVEGWALQKSLRSGDPVPF